MEKNKPNQIKTINIILSLTGGLLMVLLSIIGYFTKSLIQVVDGLRDSVVVLETTMNIRAETYKEKNIYLKDILLDHEYRIDELEKKKNPLIN